jgi:antitoxin ParD1/3/4
MSMTSMNISLPNELKEYVEERIHSGYSTPSEYVRELIREDRKPRAKDRLDSLLLEGLDSGDPLSVNAKFWTELKKEAMAKFKPHKKSRK